MNLHNSPSRMERVSKQLWPWKPFHLVHVIASGPVSLRGTSPPWLKWKFSWFLFSTGTVLSLYYLVQLHLGSLLQDKSDEGLLDQIFGKCFCMLQYESWVLVDCCLSVLQLLLELLAILTRRSSKMGKAAVNDAVFAFVWQDLIVIFWVSFS